MDRLEEESRQERRASNMIWNAARDHALKSEYMAYADDGEAEPYLNFVIGAVHRLYDYPTLDRLLGRLDELQDGEELTALTWLGLEKSSYVKELPSRPALEYMRRDYARARLSSARAVRDREETERIEYAHWQSALSGTPELSEREKLISEAIDFPPELDAAGIAERMEKLAAEYFGRMPGQAPKKNWVLPAWMNFGMNDAEGGFFSAIRKNEGLEGDESGRKKPVKRRGGLFGARPRGTPAERAYMAECFGRSCLTPAEAAGAERRLCSGSHEGCYMLFTRGEPAGTASGERDAMIQRDTAKSQREKNREYYRKYRARNELTVNKLASGIRNTLLLKLEDDASRASSGVLRADRVWRGEYLGDDRIFEHVRRSDPGDLTVDVMLDASASQTFRQEQVSTQAYIIAEALTRCGIPVRIYSFCTLNGCTVIHIFRSYNESGKNEAVFDYCAAGWNRDGLALRAAGQLLEPSRADKKLLIILSDASPNDDMRVAGMTGLRDRSYRGRAGVEDTASEAAKLRGSGVSVICVYTGEEADMPNALRIYGRSLARIKSLDRFADTVGALIRNEINTL